MNLFAQSISYDIFCPNATIAEFLYSEYIRCPEGSYWKDVEVSGKRYSCTSRLRDLYTLSDMCERMYKGRLENLAKLFRSEINPDDYPVSYVRAHIHYEYPGMAKYIYDQLTTHGLKAMSNPVNPGDLYDLTLEDPDTIGVSCKNWLAVNSIYNLFIRPKNEFTDKILAEERTQEIIKEYNSRNSLEHSTHSLITSICVIIMFIGLISKCCA